MKVEATVRERLFSMQDPGYREFQSKLMPTVPAAKIIGVRIPQLRRYAAELSDTAEAAEFLSALPHRFYEEDSLHAFLIERMRDFDRVITELDRFLPFVDNWATCDSLSPKVFSGRQAELLPQIRRWMVSGKTYVVRFGIGMLMRHYLTDAFSPEHPAEVAALCGEEYYVNMMIAWYFATALAVRYEEILPYLAEHRLSPWVHEKTIRKAVESYRVSAEKKAELRKLSVRA